jgi:hypothetical protein
MAGGAANTLTMQINGDTVNVTDSALNYDVNTVGNVTDYTIYSDGSHNTVVAHLSLVA